MDEKKVGHLKKIKNQTWFSQRPILNSKSLPIGEFVRRAFLCAECVPYRPSTCQTVSSTCQMKFSIQWTWFERNRLSRQTQTKEENEIFSIQINNTKTRNKMQLIWNEKIDKTNEINWIFWHLSFEMASNVTLNMHWGFREQAINVFERMWEYLQWL